ncbi:MAG: hypothetical protein UU21_C0006G0040 [Candidatus Levybacteria bacterium GW2011_GWA2_40_8]|nr:MAG: hypothetical protein UU21_C0006G0040 [Candidatus Levybacteria bacterium GW2011_GWA2_40_8]
MKKLFSWVFQNILFLETIFLLIFIPLYPKIPILDVKNTWVYIRAEDFIILFAFFSLALLLVKKKITLQTPLTLPILFFWLIGAVATIHAVLLVFPKLANVFPNVAFLSLLRHIEYMGVFFIAYLGTDRKKLPWIIGAIVTTLTGVIFYGFGQKFLNFPAYLTMNEEFAKGTPIRLSELGRVPSTFAGHYDLAAYLVLIIPILVSLAFSVKSYLVRIGLFAVSLLGFVLLFMTVSRVSFVVLFISLFIVLYFQKRKIALFVIPAVVTVVLMLVSFQPSLLNRFKGTVSKVDVLVDAKTGASIGHVKFVSRDFFRDKIVLRRRVKDKQDLANALAGKEVDGKTATESAIYEAEDIPEIAPLVTAVNISTGENLPSGTGYVNLELSPVTKRLGNFFYELPPNLTVESTASAQILVIQGDFIVKEAQAFDLSFTTRFQGEWPNAAKAFERNILFGSGYGSVSLAVDNNYLRMLAETGILGLITFLLIFLGVGIYIKKTFGQKDSLSKGFVLGFSAGVVGLFLNAILIDVFEASKIAFTLWLLIGVVMAIVFTKDLDFFTEVKKVVLSKFAILIYLLILSLVLFSPFLDNYFIGDDFTWLRWIADCKEPCAPTHRILDYFTNSSGFFYRPGTKLYFDFMYQFFWLNQVIYHLFSILIHFATAASFFLLAQKILKNKTIAGVSALLFLLMSGHLEAVFWIAATGHLINALFGILSLLLFIYWEERRKIYLYIGSFISVILGLTFHELGVVFPIFIIAYKFKEESWGGVKNLLRRTDYLLLFLPIIVYLILRFISESHWFSGDYSYNIILLPFNLVGNLIGYILLIVTGPLSLSIYESVRLFFANNLLIAVVFSPILFAALYVLYRTYKKIFSSAEQKTILFGLLFTIISLLPFLGLGNITSRYSYLATAGIIFVLAILGRKAYEYLLINGERIALMMLSVMFSVFLLLHVMQLQAIHGDWHDAGKKTKNFYVSIDALYKGYWSEKDISFHFVNVPIREGNAWIFPVGLSDAVWLAFRNSQARIFTHSSVSELNLKTLSYKHIVLVFNPNGSVYQIHFTKEPQE